MDKLGRPFLTDEEEECGWPELPEGTDAALRAVELEGAGIALSAVESEGPGNALSAVDPEGLGIAPSTVEVECRCAVLRAVDPESPDAALSAVDPESPGAALGAVEQALGWWVCCRGVIRGWRKGRFSLKDVRTFFVFFFLFCSSNFKILESLRFLSEKIIKNLRA